MTAQAGYALYWSLPHVFAVVSGDADMVPVVQEAASYGFHVHVCSWWKSLSFEFIRLAQNPAYGGRTKVCILDRYLNELTLKRSLPTA